MIQCILVAIVYTLGILDSRIGGQNIADEPIVVGALTGLVCGDLTTGLIMGAELQLIFMGFVRVGVTSLPNSLAGSILAVAFCLRNGISQEEAIAMSMPVALLFQPLGTIIRTINNIWVPRMEAEADKANTKGMEMYFWFGVATFAIVSFVPMFVAAYLGGDAVEALLGVIPQVILNGMTKASSILPALGIALLMNYVVDSDSIPYVILGFVLSAYLGMDSLSIAAIGLVIALVYYNFKSKKA